MQSNRAYLSIASVFLTVSAALAQQPATTAQSPPKLPTCTPSMIVGTWYAAFGYGTPIYGTAQNNGFACPLNIAANGTITSGTCILGSAMTVSGAFRGCDDRQVVSRGRLDHVRLLQPRSFLRQFMGDVGFALALG
jgi:hypothetical protein